MIWSHIEQEKGETYQRDIQTIELKKTHMDKKRDNTQKNTSTHNIT